MEKKLSYVYKALIILSAYFLLDYVLLIFFSLKGLYRSNVLLFNIIKLTSILGIIIALDWKNIKEEIKNFNQGKKVIFFIEKVFYGILILLGIKIGCSIISTSLVHMLGSDITNTENQQLIESLLGKTPSLMILSACILAPIVEELVFRGAIRKVLKNKGVFIAVSGITFGLVHVSGSFILFLLILAIGVLVNNLIETKRNNRKLSDIIKVPLILIIMVIIVFILYYLLFFASENGVSFIEAIKMWPRLMDLDLTNQFVILELINDIPYIGMGCYLAYLCSKENNNMVNISVHALNNIISVILILIIK